jgi:small-conductance mechanosensitive channel
MLATRALSALPGAAARPTSLPAGAALRAAPLPARRAAAPRRAPAPPAAAAPAAAAAAPAVTWAFTGVPLVDELGAFATIGAAGLHAAQLVVAAAAAVALGARLLALLGARIEARAADAGPSFPLLAAATGAFARPAAKLLPLYCATYSATVAAALVQVAAARAPGFNARLFGRGDAALAAVKLLTQIVQDCTEVIAVVFVAWTLKRLKDRAFRWLAIAAPGGPTSGAARILSTAGSALNWAIYIGATFAAIHTFGFDITPLLASLGGASVIVGLAAQSALGTLAASLQLFANPPFKAGDEVKLLAGGATVAEGRVIAIEPTRTTLRTPDGATLFVSNAKVISFDVLNLSMRT